MHILIAFAVVPPPPWDNCSFKIHNLVFLSSTTASDRFATAQARKSVMQSRHLICCLSASFHNYRLEATIPLAAELQTEVAT